MAKKTSKRPTRTVLFLDVSPQTKAWVKTLCKAQPDYVSKSRMVEKIMRALREKPETLTQLGLL